MYPFASGSKPSTTLVDTIFEKTYAIFGVENDEELIYKMCLIGTLYTIAVGISSIFMPAPYGRYSANGNKSPWYYGPLINARIGWMIQEMPAWIIPALLIYTTKCVHFDSIPNFVLIILFMTHYIQRSVVYPLKMTGKAKPTTFMIVLYAMLFCTFNGLLQGHYLLNVQRIDKSPFFYSGVLLFAIGMAINIHHDGILVNLKLRSESSGKKTDNGRTEYKIPQGSLFEYVSGANYFGEIMEWWGFAVATGHFPQILFAIFTTVFLGVRAWHHHHFYLSNFKNYPKSRKAVFPFLI